VYLANAGKRPIRKSKDGAAALDVGKVARECAEPTAPAQGRLDARAALIWVRALR